MGVEVLGNCPICGAEPGNRCRKKKGYRQDPKTHRHTAIGGLGVNVSAGALCLQGGAAAGNGADDRNPPSVAITPSAAAPPAVVEPVEGGFLPHMALIVEEADGGEDPPPPPPTPDDFWEQYYNSSDAESVTIEAPSPVVPFAAPAAVVDLAPVEPEAIIIDATMARAIARCSTEAALKYVYDYVSMEEKVAADAGTAFHKACELYFQGCTTEQMVATFASLYHPPAEVEPRLKHANLVRIVDYWARHHPPSVFPFKIEAAEQPGRIRLGALADGTPVYYIFRIDFVASEGPFLLVGDIKSTKKLTPYWCDQWMTAAQLTGYVWAAMNGALPEHLREKPVIGAAIIAVEFREIPTSTYKCRQGHGVPYSECGILHCQSQVIRTSRVPDQLEEWRLGMLHLAQRYADLRRRFPLLEDLSRVRMQGLWNGSCTFCDFRRFCLGGRQRGLVDSMLVKSRWSPFPGAR